MKLSQLIRSIPSVNAYLKKWRPRIEDILLEVIDNEKPIITLDIGANTGQTIDFYNRIFNNAQIYSFEPTPSLFDGLTKKYSPLKNVHLQSIALSDKEQDLDFFISDFTQTNSIKEPNIEFYEKMGVSFVEKIKETKKITIQATTLDKWAKTNLNDEIIDLIKIDTQGAEYEVIKGGLETFKEKVKYVYFEVQYLDFYNDVTPFYKIYEMLYECGFSYYCKLEAHKRNKYQEIEADILFVNRKFQNY